MEVRLPQEGMAMQDATIVKWLKSVGDVVTKGEALLEAESDKTSFEVTAPASGVLVSIAVSEGDDVPVRAVLGTIATPEDPTPTGAPAADTSSPPGVAAASVQVVPAARRLAREHRLDLSRVAGSGPAGRITEADVRAALSPTGAADGHDVAIARTIPLRGVRGRIAERMLASLHSMAQLTLWTEADVTDLVTSRKAAKGTLRVTYSHLLLRATAMALRHHPRLNALVQDGEIRECQDIHIGIAVPIGDGLIVPVVRHADRMSLLEIVKAADAVVGQVQAGRASPDLVRGGTFTISNLGSLGIDAFTPIINPPEVAILGVGRITDRPIRLDDDIAWRQVINLSLTVDHRAVDGVPAAQFLQTLTDQLAHPQTLFS